VLCAQRGGGERVERMIFLVSISLKIRAVVRVAVGCGMSARFSLHGLGLHKVSIDFRARHSDIQINFLDPSLAVSFLALPLTLPRTVGRAMVNTGATVCQAQQVGEFVQKLNDRVGVANLAGRGLTIGQALERLQGGEQQ